MIACPAGERYDPAVILHREPAVILHREEEASALVKRRMRVDDHHIDTDEMARSATAYATGVVHTDLTGVLYLVWRTRAPVWGFSSHQVKF